MYIALTVALVLFSIVLHELGHAFAMWSRGVEIEAMGFWFGPFGLKLTLGPFTCRFGNNVRFTLGLLPLGAYVRTSKKGLESMEHLSYADSARITGAGIVANLWFAFFLLVLRGVIDARFFSNRFAVGLILVSGIGAIVLWFWGGYVMPPVGATLLGLIAFSIVAIGPTEAVVGPVGTGKLIIQYAFGMPQALSLAAILSLSLGLTNMLPIMPLDGGQAVRILIEKKAPRLRSAYGRLSACLFAALLACVLYSEMFRK